MINVRVYTTQDREAVRRISCETSFLGMSRQDIFYDDDFMADALTASFTDYEPQSCFVAEDEGEVIGYVIGSLDVKIMRKILNFKVVPRLFLKSLKHRTFFNRRNFIFLWQIIKSLLKLEFLVPDFSEKYRATLHINIDAHCRGRGVGRQLIDRYLAYLKEQNVSGVHLGTTSEEAKEFFIRQGFEILHRVRRTYLRKYRGREINFYLLGRCL